MPRKFSRRAPQNLGCPINLALFNHATGNAGTGISGRIASIVVGTLVHDDSGTIGIKQGCA